jgi:hypothetical protein
VGMNVKGANVMLPFTVGRSGHKIPEYIPSYIEDRCRPTCGSCSLKGPKRGRKCELCISLPSQADITSSATNRTHSLCLKDPADCDSKFVVYCITCTQSICGTDNMFPQVDELS